MEYTVQPGDTLFSIAQRFGVTLARLLAANPGITNPDAIYVGQRINIPAATPPAGTTYVVQRGDTLYLIARRFGVTVAQLVAANPQLTNPNVLVIGQSLTIPVAAPPPGPPPGPPATTTYQVQPGDTLYLIAQRFHTSVDELVRLNPQVTNPSQIYPGQQLVVPAAAPPSPPPPSPVTPPPGCVVYVGGPTRESAQIWRTDSAGFSYRQLTTDPAHKTFPRWSPDGRLIAYAADDGLHVMDPCGLNQRKLANAPGVFTWSHDGTTIAYTDGLSTFLVTPAGQSRKAADNFQLPDFFPGDQRLAGDTTVTDINYAVLATLDLATGVVSPVLEPRPVPGGRVLLSPDGRFAAIESVAARLNTVWIYNFPARTLAQLPGHPFETSPGVTEDRSFLGGWAPDSSRLVYVTWLSSAHDSEIRLVSPEGTLLTSFPRGYETHAEWSPYSDWIILDTYDVPPASGIARNTYVRQLSTGAERRIASDGVDETNPDWSASPCLACS